MIGIRTLQICQTFLTMKTEYKRNPDRGHRPDVFKTVHLKRLCIGVIDRLLIW